MVLTIWSRRQTNEVYRSSRVPNDGAVDLGELIGGAVVYLFCTFGHKDSAPITAYVSTHAQQMPESSPQNRRSPLFHAPCTRYLNTRSVLAMSQVGTPLYMSPETLKGQGHDMVSDIWSLGCVLYELAMLTSPFAGEHLTMKAVRGEEEPERGRGRQRVRGKAMERDT